MWFGSNSRYSQLTHTVLLFSPLVLFVLLDRRIWQDDLSQYGLLSLKLANELQEHNLGSWVSMLFTQDYFGKAPLMVWVLQFPALLFFINCDLNTVYLLFQLIIVGFSVFFGNLIIKEFNLKNNSYFFGYCFLGVNLINGISKSNYVENLQFMIILLTIYNYITLPKKMLSRLAYNCIVISLVALLFLVKTNTPIFCWPFILMMIYENRNSSKFSKFQGSYKEITILISTLLLIFISLAWYVSNFQEILSYAISATGDMWSYNLSTADRFLKILIDIQSNFISLIILIPMSILAFLTTIRKNTSNFNKILIALMLTLFSDVIYFMLIDNSDPRLLYPILGLLVLILSLLFAKSSRSLRIFSTATVAVTFWYVSINALNINSRSISDHALVLQANSTPKNDLNRVLLKGCPIQSHGNRIMLVFRSPELTQYAFNYHLFQLQLKDKIPKNCKVIDVLTTEGAPIPIREVQRMLTLENFSLFIDSTAEWKKNNLYHLNWSGNINNTAIIKAIKEHYPKLDSVRYHKEWIVYEVRR